MRTWDVYDGKSQLEVLQHSHDVLALAWRSDGKQLASSTLDGQIYFWNAQVGLCGEMMLSLAAPCHKSVLWHVQPCGKTLAG